MLIDVCQLLLLDQYCVCIHGLGVLVSSIASALWPTHWITGVHSNNTVVDQIDWLSSATKYAVTAKPGRIVFGNHYLC
jgi:hypothetical protein